MASHANPTCAKCTTAHNGLNGRFCKLLKIYVERSSNPPCQTNKKQ